MNGEELRFKNPYVLSRLVNEDGTMTFYGYYYCEKCKKEHLGNEKIYNKHTRYAKKYSWGRINKQVIEHPEILSDLAVGTDAGFKLAEKFQQFVTEQTKECD